MRARTPQASEDCSAAHHHLVLQQLLFALLQCTHARPDRIPTGFGTLPACPHQQPRSGSKARHSTAAVRLPTCGAHQSSPAAETLETATALLLLLQGARTSCKVVFNWCFQAQ